jgi:hypothetical protein
LTFNAWKGAVSISIAIGAMMNVYFGVWMKFLEEMYSITWMRIQERSKYLYFDQPSPMMDLSDHIRGDISFWC